MPERLNRRLAAVLIADVAGYSRLMSRDEEATHRQAVAIRHQCIEPAVAKHGGRIVKTTGDGFFVEFASVVDALRCAIEMQDSIAAINAPLPTDRRMLYRMGVNVGDVIVEAEDIFGDGVNVAARLQALAEPGTVAISGKVRDEIDNRLDVELQDLGAHAVKNIPKPVHVFQVGGRSSRFGWLMRSRAGRRTAAAVLALISIAAAVAIFLTPPERWRALAASVPLLASLVPADTTQYAGVAIPKGPSLAVMPFENLTGDPSRSYIADGLAENITSTLSMLSNMLVVSRYSVMAYKDKRVPVQQVAREQGVSHVLAASVQQSAERYRVTAELVDARSGRVIWSERYDRSVKDVLATQDEITRNIVTALRVNLNEGEQARAFDTQTKNFEAWSLAMRGYALFGRIDPESSAQSRRLLEQAIALEPGYAWAWTYLAANYALAARFGFGGDRTELLQRAFDAATRAIELDPNLPNAHATLGSIYLIRREHDKAIAEGRVAVALGPNDSEAHALLGQSLYQAGQFAEAVTEMQKAERLSPRYPSWYLYVHAPALVFLGNYKDAIPLGQRGIELAESPFNLWAAHLVLAFALVESGRVDEARVHAAQAAQIVPGRGIQVLIRTSLARDPKQFERYVAALRKAGLPE